MYDCNNKTTKSKSKKQLPTWSQNWLLTDSTDTSLSKLQEMVKDREAWHAVVRGVAKS